MAKKQIAFVCTECGAEYSKWQGQCAACQAWNTISEFRLPGVAAANKVNKGLAPGSVSVHKMSEVKLEAQPRISTGLLELDRVLGGGLVPGAAILLGGNPGAGKSTLLLQVLCTLAQQHKALYVTGEESLAQVAMRAQRLGLHNGSLDLFAETDLESIMQVVSEQQPKILVVDSIQVVYQPQLSSAPGSVSQVRECAAQLVRFAKQSQTVLLLVGHVTKEGSLAGPKVLEHMIDTSVLLDSSDDSRFRTLRSHKNRFGAVNEIGVFVMLETGLKEVKNPSAIFLNRGESAAPGSLVTVLWEGTRPLLVEIQALVDTNQFGHPRRLAVGLEQNRLAMLLAVLHRHAGVQSGDQDVFVNAVGGVKVLETSADLALLLAIVSSLRNRAWPQDTVAFGEVGLSGEIRAVPNGQERIQEAVKHGFRKAIVPKANQPRQPIEGIEIIAVSKLQETIQVLDDLCVYSPEPNNSPEPTNSPEPNNSPELNEAP